MAKIKTLSKQKEFSKNTLSHLKPHTALERWTADRLLDVGFIGKAIMECLQHNDPEGVVEIIAIHLNAVNKVRAAHKAKLARSTLYNSLYKSKNPTIKTLAKLMHASTLDTKKAL
ncbi:hypothetical protein H0X06_05560 [Candidatus Dependentiae bacterium]|nr:hypothetical protein [Candidatus Dependentiae bacterium]